MIRSKIIIIFLLFSLFSCKVKIKEEPIVVKKFIFTRLIIFDRDSINERHFGIIDYFEYNYNKDCQFKFAGGNIYNLDTLYPLFGSARYFESAPDNKTIELINKTITNKNFNPKYKSNLEIPLYCFLYETSDNKNNLVIYGKRDIPDESILLIRQINELRSQISEATELKPVKPFHVDPIVKALADTIKFK